MNTQAETHPVTTEVAIVYIGRRETTKGKVIPFFRYLTASGEVDLEQPSFAFQSLKSIPAPVGTILSITRAEDGGWFTGWNTPNGMKPKGMYSDADQVVAWDIDSRNADSAQRMGRALKQSAGELDRRLDAIMAAIDKLDPFSRPAARQYVISRLLGASKK